MRLTPNQRMALFLKEALPLSVWLENLYSASEELPQRLSIQEELVIWEKIISKSSVSQNLFKAGGTARLAREAWMLSVQWKMPELTDITTEDVEAYREWASSYQALCCQNHWVDSATFVDALIDPIVKKKISLPKEITLVGFEELTPQLTHFFDRMREAGTEVKSTTLVSVKGEGKRVATADAEEELRYAARMAKRWLSKSEKGLIGIVVPDLEKQRHQVVRIFEEILPPETFNVSAPIALYRYPMIEAALLALNLLSHKSSLEKYSQFLRSPFFGEAEAEKLARAVLDVQLREWGEGEFTFDRFIKISDACPKWLERLQCVSQEQTTLRGKKSVEEWRVKILALLEMLGWPGDRLLNTEEQEIQQCWHRLLAEYVNMGRILPPHDYQEAISHLMRLARGISFLPTVLPLSSDRPVQILGLLEAVGVPFDYLWVTGLHREAWPLTPAPNPFIFSSLQRTFDLPRSSPQRELKMAKKFTERLCEGAKEVIFSYPTTVDGNPSTVSALLEHLPEITPEDYQLSKALSSLALQGQIKPFNFTGEERAPKVEASEKVLGGTGTLKSQALCPFRAFAENRLQAHPLPATKTLGLSAALRGELIHQVLQFFWMEIENQAQLNALSEEALNDKLKDAIEQVFEDWQAHHPSTLTPYYMALEKKRTYQLMSSFILLEKSRPYFEVVGREIEKTFDFEGLSFKMRMDRIDRLSNGDEIIIDYKTGEVSLHDWFSERLKNPQLPLYCVTSQPRASGIVYGIIRPDAVKFQGITKNKSVLPGTKTLEASNTWEEQCETWEAQIHLLAKEFTEGVATVDPIEGANTCRTCSLKPLCRVTSLSS